MAQFASATFTAANGTELNAADANWSKLDGLGGNLEIQDNRACSTFGATTPRYYHSATPPSADYEVSADLYVVATTTSQNAGVIARAVVGVWECYWARYRPGTGWQLFRYNNGTATQLGSTVVQTLAVGSTTRVRLRVEGNVISVYRDAETTPIISVTDSSPLTNAGKAGVQCASVPMDGVHLDNWSADTLGEPDTIPPTLTTPTGTQTGSTAASGTVSTNEANGTLYYLASTNATETATTVKAAASQAVTTAGSQTVSFTGLTASTTYYAHYLHRDAAGNDSSVASSTSFTTAASTGDETAPTLTGSITISALTTTSYTAMWPAGSDNVAVTGYEYQIDAGGWTSVGTALTVNISGRTPSTTESFQVRAFDAAGNRSAALTQSVTLETPVAGVTITEPLKNNAGSLRANESGVGVALLQTGDFTYGLTTDAAGLLETVTGAVAGQSYYVVIKTADGGVGITGPITAS